MHLRVIRSLIVPRRAFAVLCAMAVAFVAMWFASAPALASGWSLEATPYLTGPPSGGLSGVSCPSVTTCFLVGSFRGKSGTQRPLAEVRSGGVWARQRTPGLAGGGALNAVSCTSARGCTAVGNYVDSSGAQAALAERWNGTAWSIQSTPTLPGASSSVLNDVSCTSASACTAVGHYVDSSGTEHPLADAWSGTAWSVQTVTDPSSGVGLSRVSCSAADACTALAGGTTVERWNGSTWTSQSVAIPGAATSAGLDAVACPRTTLCVAVGNWSEFRILPPGCNPLNPHDHCRLVRKGGTLTEQWTGSSWAIQSTPSDAAGYNTPALSAVSCPSARTCMAVGGNVAEQWNGSAWSARPGVGSPSQLSCTSAADCTAISGTLAQLWNGSGWTPQPTVPLPRGPNDRGLSGVSCISAAACTAVGNYTNGSGSEATLAEDWNGASWVQQPTPNVSGATSSWLSGVSCTTTTACTAVGADYSGPNYNPALAVAWDGSAWSVQPTPSLNAGGAAVFSGVVCIAASACTAVGLDNSNNAAVETWNGSAWTSENPSVLVSWHDSRFSSVSCATATNCMAVGSSAIPGSADRATLAEQWDGSSWTIEPTPDPQADDSLDAVSCPAATACIAVGSASGNALAEEWDGNSWTLQTVPIPSGGTGGSLAGLSCASTSDCTAVGSYTSSSGTAMTLAEHWDGTTWSIEPTPNPAHSTGSYLSSVSCTTATTCTAVGHYQNAENVSFTLAEGYSG